MIERIRTPNEFVQTLAQGDLFFAYPIGKWRISEEPVLWQLVTPELCSLRRSSLGQIFARMAALRDRARMWDWIAQEANLMAYGRVPEHLQAPLVCALDYAPELCTALVAELKKMLEELLC